MKLKITHLKMRLFVFMLLCLSVSAFAQTKGNDKELLQGKWVLEEVSVREGNDSISINIDSLNVGRYDEIEIKKDVIKLSYKGNILQGKYVADKDFLYLSVSAQPIITEWAIFQNKLYLEQSQDIIDSSGRSKILIITSIYRRI